MRKQTLSSLLTGSTGSLNKVEEKVQWPYTSASDPSCLGHPGPSNQHSIYCLSTVVVEVEGVEWPGGGCLPAAKQAQLPLYYPSPKMLSSTSLETHWGLQSRWKKLHHKHECVSNNSHFLQNRRNQSHREAER